MAVDAAKWLQPSMGRRARATKTGRTRNRRLPNGAVLAGPGGNQPSPFQVQAAPQQDSLVGVGSSLQEAQEKAVRAMGPYVLPTVTTGQPPGTGPYAGWNGPLGSVPNHHGWQGMQNVAQQWSLRLLGAFPTLRFSSGFRTPEQNAAAGGVPNSGHMEGWKADFSGSREDLASAAAWAKRYGARVLLHDAGNGYHLDISWRGMNV